jgi:hypothetical protein
MKYCNFRTVIFVFSSLGSLFAGVPSMDPMWLYKDLPDEELLYGTTIFRDTSRSYDFNVNFPVDTGDAYDDKYVNFPYQFTTDSLIVRDEWDTNTIVYRDLRPGFAGFKINWDGGITGFSLAKFKYLAIAHKGPLSDHKVTIRFGYNTGCGTPTVFQTIGTFNSSSEWKIDSLQIPDSVRNISKSEIDERSYYEMQVLINNVNSSGSSTSDKGLLKIDDIALVDTTSGSASVKGPLNPITETPSDETEDSRKSHCGSGFGLAFIPPILFKANRLRKRKKAQ